MLCPYCRKRIDFKNRKDTKFSSESKRWYHKSCLEKLKQSEVQARVREREAEKQKDLLVWVGQD